MAAKLPLLSACAPVVDADDIITPEQDAELDRVRRAMKKGKLPAGYVPLEAIMAQNENTFKAELKADLRVAKNAPKSDWKNL